MFSNEKKVFSNEKLGNTDRTELLYKLHTEGGMSGAPIFDNASRLVGIHVGGGSDGERNYGVKLSAVLEDAKTKL